MESRREITTQQERKLMPVQYHGDRIRHQLFSYFISALDKVRKNNEENRWAGRVFVLEEINKEYPYLSANGGFLYRGSSLYQCLLKQFNVKNITELPVDRIFLWLYHLYEDLFNDQDDCKKILEEIKKIATNKLDKFIWKSVDALLTDIKTIRNEVNLRQKYYRKKLYEALPLSHLLKNNIAKIAARYDKKSDIGIDLIDVTNKLCDRYGVVDIRNLNSEIVKNMSQAYAIRIAVVLYLMSLLEEQYAVYEWFGWTAQNRTDRYPLCQEAINVKRSTDLTEKDRYFYFKHLLDYLNQFIQFKSVIHQYQIDKRAFENVKKNLPYLIKQLETYLNPLLPWAPHQHKSNGKVKAETTINYCVQKTFCMGMHNIVTKTILPKVSNKIITSALGAIGFFIYGPGGALIAATLGEMAVSSTLSYAIGSLAEPIGQKIIAPVTNSVVSVIFNVTKKGLELTLHSHYPLSKDQIALFKDQEWLLAIYETSTLDEQKKLKTIRDIPEKEACEEVASFTFL